MNGKQKKDHRGRASDDPFWKGCGKRIGFAPLNKEKDFGTRLMTEKIAYGVTDVCGCVVRRILLLKAETRKQKTA